jgi:hypothetical protein
MIILDKRKLGQVIDWAPKDSDHIIQYEVTGLPSGHMALIGEMEGARWKILRRKCDDQGRWGEPSWEGDYETANEALAILKGEFEK